MKYKNIYTYLQAWQMNICIYFNAAGLTQLNKLIVNIYLNVYLLLKET